MDERTNERDDVDHGTRRVSAWPVFVAVGLALGELGVVFGSYPVAVGGLLLFVGSVSGIVSEAGYVDRPWRLLAGLGVALGVAGALVIASQVSPSSLDAVVATADSQNGVVVRGYAIVGAGVVALVASGAGAYLDRTGPEF